MVLSATLRTVLSMTMASSPTTCTPRISQRRRWMVCASTSDVPLDWKVATVMKLAYGPRIPHYRYETDPYRNLFQTAGEHFRAHGPGVQGGAGVGGPGV